MKIDNEFIRAEITAQRKLQDTAIKQSSRKEARERADYLTSLIKKAKNDVAG